MQLSRPFRAHQRLATQLVALVVLVALLSGGAVGALVVERARQALRESILNTDLATADLAASLASVYMTEAQGDARELAASSELRTAAANGDLASATAVLEQWHAEHSNLLGVGLVGLNGVTLATGLPDKSFVNTQMSVGRDWFQGALATGEPFLGTPSMSPVTQRPQVPYGVPLRDEAGSVRAIIIASISLEGLSDTLAAVSVGPNARTSLDDLTHSLILVNAERSRILAPSSGKDEASKLMYAGQRGAMENVNSSGQRTLAAFTQVPGLRWGVFIQQPSEDAFRAVEEMVRQVAILIAVALMVAAGVGGGLALGILRPIRHLRNVLDATASGDLSNRVRTTRQDELGELGRGFDHMADQLQATLTDLREGEERFRGLIAAAFDGFAIHQGGRILEANRQFAMLFGYEPAELVGRSVLDLTAPEWRDVVLRNITGDIEELYDGVGLRKNDTRFYMELVDRGCSYERRPARAIAVRDVTVRKEAEEQRSRMAAMMMSSGDAIIGTVGRAIVTDWNAGAERLYGYSAQEMVGRSVECLIPTDCGVQMAQVRERLNRGERVQNFETQRLRKDGTRVDVSISISLVVDRAERSIGAVTVARDISERKHLEEQLRRQALHDELTGLPNRTLLQDRLSHELLTARRENTPMTLLLVDLDRFKEINDTFGHHYGDLLLEQIGPRLRAVLRDSDTVARLGGDEFGILLPTSDSGSAVAVAQQLLRMLEAPFELDGQTVEIGASIGVASYPAHGSDTATLLRRADVAMYVAKRGDSGIVVYTPEQDHYTAQRLALGGELRSAIDNSELLLHFQPKLDMRDGILVGVEALVRWQHPIRGFLPPSEFILLAEQTGLIIPLTRWVLEAALWQHRAWRDMGLDIPVAVNLSRRTLHDPRLPELVAQLLAQNAVPPSALVLEITESSLMADPLRAAENLSQLRALGVQMSIDDFGTGYSSLDSLKDLSVDELKIDRSFVQAMASDGRARAIVRAIIDLADALELRVVAEGVEDRATWDVLAALGCDTAQGYFLCGPIAAAELDAWIADVSHSWLDIAAKSRVEDALQERIRGRGARLTAEEEFISRKQAEAALRASEERNRLALQAARMGTWDYDVIHDVQTWSAEMQALHGLVPGAFEGTFAAFKRAVHPGDWPAFEVEMLAAQAERRDSIGTYRSVWPDGSVRWLENQSRPIFAADGTLLRSTGTCLDITERKQAEEALRTSEERFRRQYKGIPLPTYSWLAVENDFVLQDYNDAAELNPDVNVHHWLGRRASELFLHQQQSLANLHQCLNEQRTVRRERRDHDAAMGQDRHLMLTYVFVPPGTVMVHREDITDVKQAEQQRDAMERSEKLRALGQMATGIAHDLNQSLMLVASYSDLARQALLQAPPDLVELQDLLTTTTQAALDGGETVKRLLLFTRAPSEHDGKQVDLRSVVRDAVQLTAPRWRDAAQAERRHISLHIEADGNPTVQGSPARLRELMTNLIFNAVDALPTGGTIRLRVGALDGQGIIEVVDSGLGMSAEVQARVFEPFFTTKGEGGTGLGLAMVFGIVEQHGGHIEVRSALGEGTTVHLTFPLMDASPDAESSMATTQLEPPRPLRVLTVDDEPMMTKAVVRMLKPSGHVVTVAASGEEALEKLVEQTFDVVVSDMGMGAGMNGLELADAVKRRWPDVRFLLATGWGAAIDPAEARARGVEAVLSKPYHPVDLLQALARSDAAA